MATSYDSTDITLLVGGLPMAGFGDNKLVVARSNDSASVIEGTDGEIIFAKSNKTSGTISFDLLYGTDYDLYMDQLSNVSYIFPVAFSHIKSSKNLVTWGMLQTQPDIELGETPANRTWTLIVQSVEMSLGGISALYTPAPYVPTTALRV